MGAGGFNLRRRRAPGMSGFLATIAGVALMGGAVRGAEPVTPPAPMLVAPKAVDAERAMRAGYRVTLRLSSNDGAVTESDRVVRANESFSAALEQGPHWRLQLAAAPAGAGRIRLVGRIEAGVPPSLVSEPDLMLAEARPGTIVVTTPDGASRFKAEIVLAPIQLPSEVPPERVKRLSPDMHPTPLAPERDPNQSDGGNGAVP